MATGHYSRGSLGDAIFSAGVRPGDVLFSHGNIGYFGYPEEGRRPEQVLECIVGAFTDVLGPNGTLVVPTFSYSFCNGEAFDVASTPSACGALTEYVRGLPGAVRSHDPIFSVACFGGDAERLATDVGVVCFGEESFWERFLSLNGAICNLNFDAGSTFVHYVERQLGVPYRYDKLFRGRVVQEPSRREAIFACRDLSNPGTRAAFELFDEIARQERVAVSKPVGRGAVVALRAADTFSLIERELVRSPWFLTQAGKTGQAATLIATPPEATKPGPSGRRDVVSLGQNRQVADLEDRGFTAHRLRTGTALGPFGDSQNVFVPESFEVVAATIEGDDGSAFDLTSSDVLWVAPYSASFQGTLSRNELLKRIERAQKHSPLGRDPYYEGTWELVGDAGVVRETHAAEYSVVLKTSLQFGEMAVAELPADNPAAWLCVDTLGLDTRPPLIEWDGAALDELRRVLLELKMSLWMVPGPLGLRAALKLAEAPARVLLPHDIEADPQQVLDYWGPVPSEQRLVPIEIRTKMGALAKAIQGVSS